MSTFEPVTTKELKRLKERCAYHTERAVWLQMRADEHSQIAAQYEFQIREHLNSL